jgi:DNA modification methylase
MVRQLWTGDNMEMLATLDDGCAGLIYLDPPFASNRSYDAVVSSRRLADNGHSVPAFDDRWSSADLAAVGLRELERRHALAADLVKQAARVNPDLSNYLLMILPRLLESHRVLAEPGSLYVHCDTAASHYLKTALDAIFGPGNFRNEIIWKRTHAHSSSRRFGPVHDVILFYSRSSEYTWNPGHTEYEDSYIRKYFRQVDERGAYQLITCTAPGDRQGTRAHYEWRGQFPPPGRHWAWQRERMEELEAQGLLVYSANGVPRLRRYVDDGPGLALQDLWLDINRLDAHSEERVGYETQKPVALLERIIQASTNEGDLVVDPFCGTGTTMVAAERLKRGWVGGDKSLLAMSYALARVRQEAGSASVSLRGFPQTEADVSRLFREEVQTYGVWGASILATLADRRALTETVATGRGRLKTPRRRVVELMSWIPLARTGLEPSTPRSGRRLPNLGLVLRNGRAATQLVRQISLRLPALTVREIDPALLVQPTTRRNGMPDVVTKWVTDAA